MKLNLDVRIGCVAVYYGEKINCFSDLPDRPDLMFYASGKWDDKKNGWVLSWRKILSAKLVYLLNRRAEREEGKDGR